MRDFETFSRNQDQSVVHPSKNPTYQLSYKFNSLLICTRVKFIGLCFKTGQTCQFELALYLSIYTCQTLTQYVVNPRTRVLKNMTHGAVVHETLFLSNLIS